MMNAMKSEIRSSTKFICETLFKLAVEQAINSNYLANLCEADAETAERLREACARTVAENNGILTMEDAARWQNG